MILIINVYLSLVFRLRLEYVAYKISVYWLILTFFLLRILTNLNFKTIRYDRVKNFKEI